MSELKAVHAFDVYEAYTKTGDDDAAQVYLKSEADKVIAELKDKCNMHDFFWEGCGFAKRGFKNSIAVSEAFEKLEAENKRLEKCCKEYDSRQRIDERIKFSAAKRLRNQKYKRCLAMAMWCDAAYHRECGLNPEEMTDKEFYKQQIEFWPRWSSRWLEIAEKFKPNSTAPAGPTRCVQRGADSRKRHGQRPTARLLTTWPKTQTR